MNYQTASHELIRAYKDSDGNAHLILDVIIPKDDASEEFINDISSIHREEFPPDFPLMFTVTLHEDSLHIHKSVKPNISDEEVNRLLDHFNSAS